MFLRFADKFFSAQCKEVVIVELPEHERKTDFHKIHLTNPIHFVLQQEATEINRRCIKPELLQMVELIYFGNGEEWYPLHRAYQHEPSIFHQ